MSIIKERKKHWMLGTKSFLEFEKMEYNIGIESLETNVFLESQIIEPVVFKSIIPRFYNGLIRNAWSPPQMYDPMITVENDQVSFIMHDIANNINGEKGYWELVLNERVFQDYNVQKGVIFVDFNNDFIEQVKKLKSKSKGMFRVDKTGMEYAEGTDATFLPNEKRDVLIKLLKQIKLEMASMPDKETEVNTKDVWDQCINRKFLVDETLREEFQSLFDFNSGGGSNQGILGEVYNPFYRLGMNKQLSDKSRIVKYFGDKMIVKYWEDSNEYLLEIPLKEDLGTLRFQVGGRRTSRIRN